ncbi:hypothetical protein TSUD_141910 [Trifolium subterraneum]|uniref:RNase H type-1 domain-containing protein n=1 Tax=Trifolium subterraneum TaxID=3900 RepID=A0A2Z6LUN5_TRISU|nr:hypothetical protein TSUD_141910 [Trifolium subterraneum]
MVNTKKQNKKYIVYIAINLYSSVHHVEARGHSGGIWLLKQQGSNITADVFEVYKDTITVRLSLGNAKWFLSGIYASPVNSSRLDLWNNFTELRRDITEPWLLMGDFNEIIRPSEQKGGTYSHSRAVPLLNVMNNCNLVDVKTTGGLFTWSRPCTGNRMVFRKLDRVLADVPWCMAFLEAYVEVLCKFHSYHKPLLLRCGLPRQNYGPRPFRFEAAWIIHPDYSDIVKVAWGKTAGDFIGSLQQVQHDSIIFNKECFGNIRKRKAHLERRLKGIQNALERVDSARLIYLQRDLQQAYDLILRQEEIHWYQKAIEDWIKLGDRNTKFFHTKTVIRRKRNKIHGLHLPNGLWCTDDDLLRGEAHNYFKKLFCSSSPSALNGINDGPHSPTLNEEACRSLTSQITKEEVAQALNQMHPFKAPGPDRFQGIFFKQYWHIIGDDVVRLISTVFETGGFPPSLSETLIALIPKMDCPNNFKEFRPISLCNTVYKLITKIMVNRLRPFLNQIIGPYQSSFLPGRGTTDNPVRLSRNGPPLSHLFFADDVLLFAKATKSQALNIASTLKSFADYSGLQVNVSKSKVFFSSNIRRGKISSIVTSTGINRTLSLEKYLGFPMMHGRLQRRDFEFLEEKISKSLASWKHNLLNKAGRMTLVKSVLNSIPNYYMQIAWLPQSTCDFIDRMARNFLWKGSSDTGMHLVGWDKITKPKKLGGLGIRKAREANTSLLDGFHYRLGNGNNSFWFTDWSGNDMLANQVLFIDIHDLEIRVRDVHIASTWNFNSLCNTHLETTLHCLRDCDFAQSIWKSIGFSNLNFFQGDDPYVWIRNGLHCSSMFLFMATIWWIWRARNALCLNSESILFYSLKLRIMDYALLIENCHSNHHDTSTSKLVKWNALGGTGMILNVDGSSLGNPGISGFGGLIHNADGAWVLGFFGNLGVNNILHAELRAIYKGLLLAWDLNIKDLWCYSDSEMAIKLISESVDQWHHYAAILNNIQDILRRDWQVLILHTFREGNAYADYLAKHGANNNKVFSSIATPPAGLNLSLLADASGTWFSR